MKSFLTFLEDTSIVVGGALGLAQIETILGIVLLIFQLCLIAWKCGYAIYKHVKAKEFEKIEEEIQKAVDDIDSLNK